MKIKYFQETDSPYIELRATEISETRNLDENTIADLDAGGRICALIIEHASIHADIPHFRLSRWRRERVFTLTQNYMNRWASRSRE